MEVVFFIIMIAAVCNSVLGLYFTVKHDWANSSKAWMAVACFLWVIILLGT